MCALSAADAPCGPSGAIAATALPLGVVLECSLVVGARVGWSTPWPRAAYTACLGVAAALAAALAAVAAAAGSACLWPALWLVATAAACAAAGRAAVLDWRKDAARVAAPACNETDDERGGFYRL